jgi:hypothetical protein
VISTDKQGLSFEQTRTNIIFGRNDVVAISKCLTLILATKMDAGMRAFLKN